MIILKINNKMERTEVRAICPICKARGIMEYDSEIKEEVALAKMIDWQANHCKPDFITSTPQR